MRGTCRVVLRTRAKGKDTSGRFESKLTNDNFRMSFGWFVSNAGRLPTEHSVEHADLSFLALLGPQDLRGDLELGFEQALEPQQVLCASGRREVVTVHCYGEAARPLGRWKSHAQAAAALLEAAF